MIKNRFNFAVVFLVLVAIPLFSEEMLHETYGWGIHIPAGWQIFNYDETSITFTDPQTEAFVQVYTFNGAEHNSSLDLLAVLENGFGVDLEIAPIDYRSERSVKDVSMGYLLLENSQFPMEGYALAFNEDHQDVLLFAFTKIDIFPNYADSLISALDSFLPSMDDFPVPGALSQFLSVSAPSNQDIIDREARILQAYAEAPLEIRNDAWRRFYQVIYRDNFIELEGLADEIDRSYMAEGIPHIEYPSRLLSDLQSFEFIRTGTLSDLVPPMVCYNTGTGDCDSLALLYMGILEHWGIESVLMISDVHKHAMVGVDTVGPGARFNFNNKNYLVAELTEQVDLGLIAAGMSDPADWYGFNLHFKP